MAGSCAGLKNQGFGVPLTSDSRCLWFMTLASRRLRFSLLEGGSVGCALHFLEGATDPHEWALDGGCDAAREVLLTKGDNGRVFRDPAELDRRPSASSSIRTLLLR